MTDSPVAAANARTMWKRETPPIAATSSRVNSSARWLSINQSAFWAGVMNNGFRSKPAQYDRFAPAPFDSPCARSRFEDWNLMRQNAPSSALRKIPTKASLASQYQSCILRRHSIRRLTKLPQKKDCLSLGQHVREDDDAQPCALPRLESC